MKVAYSFLVLMILVVSSCSKPKKEGNVTLQLSAKYGSQSFAINSPNTDPQGRRMEISSFKFYLSHIILVMNDNSEVVLKDVALFDLSNPNTLTFNVADVKGDFKAIKFSCGVDSLQNLTDPLTVPSSNPLSGDNNMYWTWLKYQFEVMNVRCDTTSTGTGPFNWFPRYHIGGNSLYRAVQLSKSFSVCCDTKYTLNLSLDIKKIFYGTQTLDIITEADTQSGSTDNPVIAPKFADNFSQAFSIE